MSNNNLSENNVSSFIRDNKESQSQRENWPVFSRKNYQKLSPILAEVWAEMIANDPNSIEKRKTFLLLINTFADHLQKDNERFIRSYFFEQTLEAIKK